MEGGKRQKKIGNFGLLGLRLFREFFGDFWTFGPETL